MIQIKEIVIKIGDKDIELTPDEARELKTILDELFDKKGMVIPTFVPIPYPVYPIVPTYPWSQGTWVVTGTGTATSLPDPSVKITQ
jgi:hypothetical protein